MFSPVWSNVQPSKRENTARGLGGHRWAPATDEDYRHKIAGTFERYPGRQLCRSLALSRQETALRIGGGILPYNNDLCIIAS